ncbi:hypothetical protein [Marivita sp.]|uniref:hypothetical protein n=1 Tax=Marivita sp. TaxID=2003365 RepID=UPI0025BD825A|nr:hypothetical protein [Marivita sp.]
MAHSTGNTEAEHIQHDTNETSHTDKVRDSISSAKHELRDVANTAQTKAEDAIERSSEQVQTFQGEFDSAVRRNPTLAVLGALGVGVAIGVVMQKRN